MTSPILALRGAILAICGDDTALAVSLGGPGRIFDEPPRGEPPVYAVFDACEARDVSTSSDHGHEQELTIAVWSTPGSSASAIAAADRIAALLDDADPPLDGHRLVNLAGTAVDTARDPETGLIRVRVRIRAVTEVI